MPSHREAKAGLQVASIAAVIVAQHENTDRDIACRALAVAIGALINRDPEIRTRRVMFADLYGMHIRAAVRNASHNPKE